MKYSLMTIALAASLAGCSASATRDQLQVQNPTVLQTGLGATQDAAAGAATPQWLETYRGADNGKLSDSVQMRLDALGTRRDNYFGYKAKCWLDAAQSERASHDRWGFVEEALREADRLTTALETSNGLSTDNPDLRTSTVVRPDIWQQILSAKSAPMFPSCPEAQRLTACSEIELIHAGHEAWIRNFDGSAQLVDRVTQDVPHIGAALDACQPPPPPSPVVAIPPKVTLRADTTFKFDRADLAGMLPEGQHQLDGLIQNLKQVDDVTGIRVDGYTDRIGNDDYNRELSAKRADTVKRYLQRGGVAVPMSTRGLGKDNPVVQCDQRNRKKLIDCLEPNRRVELNFMRGNPAPRSGNADQ